MIDSDIDAIWHGQESPKTTIWKNATRTEIGLAGGRYKVLVSHGQRSWVSKEGYAGRIDPNTLTWDLIESVLESMARD